jgi:hypothetical protein
VLGRAADAEAFNPRPKLGPLDQDLPTDPIAPQLASLERAPNGNSSNAQMSGRRSYGHEGGLGRFFSQANSQFRIASQIRTKTSYKSRYMAINM